MKITICGRQLVPILEDLNTYIYTCKETIIIICQLYAFLMFRKKENNCFVSGATLAIILKVPLDPAVVISAMIAIFYTWIGTCTSLNIVQILKKKEIGRISLNLIQQFCLSKCIAINSVQHLSLKSSNTRVNLKKSIFESRKKLIQNYKRPELQKS